MTSTLAAPTARLTIAGRDFRSRLMVGTGKYRSNAEMVRAIEASGAEIVTVAVRRVDLDRTREQGILHHLSPERYFLLANTAGCYTADEAVRYARLAREAGFNDFVKLEVIGDRDTLLPDTVDGASFKDVLEGKRDRIRDVLYGVYCGGTKPGIRSVKKDGWKLIKYDVLDGKVHETQLFNLRENPFELLAEHHTPEVVALTGNVPQPNQVDLAEDPRYAGKRRELEELLMDQEERWGDPYRLWDQPDANDSK